jgi:hypothetical protein
MRLFLSAAIGLLVPMTALSSAQAFSPAFDVADHTIQIEQAQAYVDDTGRIYPRPPSNQPRPRRQYVDPYYGNPYYGNPYYAPAPSYGYGYGYEYRARPSRPVDPYYDSYWYRGQRHGAPTGQGGPANDPTGRGNNGMDRP